MPSIHPNATPTHLQRVASQAAALKAGRAAKGLTQRQAAAALSVPLGTYRAWEHGERGLPDDVAGKVAKQWGVDLAALHPACPKCGRPY